MRQILSYIFLFLLLATPVYAVDAAEVPSTSLTSSASSANIHASHGYRKHNDFIAYGLISTRELEKAASKMSPEGASRTLTFVEEIHKTRFQAWLDAVPIREEIKKGMEVEKLNPESLASYLNALEKLRQIKARESIEIDGFSDLLRHLSYGDRKILAQMVYVPKLRKPQKQN